MATYSITTWTVVEAVSLEDAQLWAEHIQYGMLTDLQGCVSCGIIEVSLDE